MKAVDEKPYLKWNPQKTKTSSNTPKGFNMRKDSYKPEEINLLKKIFINNTKIFIQSKFNRSWQSLYYTAKKLGLKRNPEIIRQEMISGGNKAPKKENIWTEEQDNFLKSIYEKTLKIIFNQRLKTGLGQL